MPDASAFEILASDFSIVDSELGEIPYSSAMSPFFLPAAAAAMISAFTLSERNFRFLLCGAAIGPCNRRRDREKKKAQVVADEAKRAGVPS